MCCPCPCQSKGCAHGALTRPCCWPGDSHRKTADQLLLRLRDTPAQSTLSRSERLTSLAGAFAVEPLQAKRLAGARVLLVDDVMTSGATLFYAARALRQAGAAHITGLVVARTPMP